MRDLWPVLVMLAVVLLASGLRHWGLPDRVVAVRARRPPRPGRTAVYLFTCHDRYPGRVGITSDVVRRVEDYRRTAWWWQYVSPVPVVEWWPTRKMARAREIRLIAELAPRFNVQDNFGRHHERPAAARTDRRDGAGGRHRGRGAGGAGVRRRSAFPARDAGRPAGGGVRRGGHGRQVRAG